MDIANGFQLERPNVFVPWRIDEDRLNDLLPGALHHVTRGYYTIACESLGGLKHQLGFHFTPREAGRLRELEFFRSEYSDLNESYQDFQKRFERVFGKPTRVEPGSDDWPTCTWSLPGVTIVHYIFDRFGLEEHMRIRAD